MMKNILLGTDWWTDCDDAVAVRLLARAHKAGEIKLIGIGINACMVVLVNLKPAKLAGVLSEGMLLCAEDAEGNLALLTPEKNMPAGAEIA